MEVTPVPLLVEDTLKSSISYLKFKECQKGKIEKYQFLRF